ncbi:hypothetical protein IFM47457_09092 [Aspergillus lentulus]|nr:hypothetical protein IFM47457_09092 [Aspergillus lentulus]
MALIPPQLEGSEDPYRRRKLSSKLFSGRRSILLPTIPENDSRSMISHVRIQATGQGPPAMYSR